MKNKLTIFALLTLLAFSVNFAQTPANNASAVVINTGFTFTAPATATTPRLQVSTASDFSDLVVNHTITTGTTTVAFSAITLAASLEGRSTFDNGTVYYWRIRDIAGAGSTVEPSAPATYYKFTTILPAVPQLVSPAHLSKIAGNIIGFQWTAPMAGIEYWLELASDSLFTTAGGSPSMVSGFPVKQLTNYYTYPFTGLSGDYYWRVKTYTTAGTPKLISISSRFKFTIPGAPTAIPIYPTNLATMYTNSPTIWWLSNNNYYNSAVYYRVRYANDATDLTDGNFLGSKSVTTTNNYIALPGLTVDGSTWKYVIDATTNSNADFATGPTTTSIEQNFVVYYATVALGGIPVYLSYPTAGTTVYTTVPTLYWFLGLQIPGLTYVVTIDDLTSSTNFVTTGNLSSSEYKTAALTPGHKYSWKVKITGGVDYGPETFTVHSSATALSTTADAAIPTLASPVGGIVVSTQSPALSWSAYSTKALEYQVTWSSDASFNPSNSSGWLVTNSYSLSALTPGVTYYWKVRSRLADGSGSPSTYSSFGQFTVSPGASPVVVLPANPIVGSAINSTAASLSWVVPAQSSSKLTYELEISKNKDLSGATLISNLKEASYKADNLSSNANYYWRVRSKNESGAYSNYSYKGQFNTGSATAVEESELPTQFSLDQNYPNPFNPTTIISYSITKSSFVSLKIFDILGREVKTLVSQDMVAGKYNLNWNGDDNFGNRVSSGTYIYRITADNFVSSKKMILIK